MNKILVLVCLLLFTSGRVFCQDVEKQQPVVYIIGDSTVKNGQDKGDRGQWGWGHFIALWFDSDRISFENHAIGGRSSRSFITEGRWEKVCAKLKKGDYVLIQFGHNDGGELNSGRARASLKGTGDEYQDIVFENADNKELEGKSERVYTYGYYLRKYICDARAKGAIPVVCSPVPRNRWKDGRIIRDEQYAIWSEQVAREEKIAFIHLNKYVADKYDILGEVLVNDCFSEDHTHTSLKGAMINAETVVEELRKQKESSFKIYLK